MTDPTIYLARDPDGKVWSYDEMPVWCEGLNGWIGHYIGGFQGSDTWPETFLPRGTMGLARLDLVDRARVASQPAESAIPTTVPASTVTIGERSA
jgi:hypothetical protein